MQIHNQRQGISHASFKNKPEDFIVTELMHIEPSGSGEHLWLYIKKTGLNTVFLAKLLADWAGVTPANIGYSGLKDRHAVTYQWFSLHLPKKNLPNNTFDEFLASQNLSAEENASILQQVWHTRKLNRGTHKANAFSITLRDLEGDLSTLDDWLLTLKHHGVPNYFGQQRFGRDGQNIDNAKRFFEKILASDKPYKPSKKDINKHALFISAARSYLFNTILNWRVGHNNWNIAIDGDVFNLDGSSSIFDSPVTQEIKARISKHDIHPVGVLYGIGENRISSQSLQAQNNALTATDIQETTRLFMAGLEKIGAKLSYRPLRLMVQEMQWEYSNGELQLNFILPRGTFATVVLYALCQNLYDKSLAV